MADIRNDDNFYPSDNMFTGIPTNRDHWASHSVRQGRVNMAPVAKDDTEMAPHIRSLMKCFGNNPDNMIGVAADGTLFWRAMFSYSGYSQSHFQNLPAWQYAAIQDAASKCIKDDVRKFFNV